jgi:serine/threonine protein kinase
MDPYYTLGAAPALEGWRVGSLLGQGTFARVYAAVASDATHEALNNVAIKFFHSKSSSEPSFDREVKALKTIRDTIGSSAGKFADHQKHLQRLLYVDPEHKILATEPVGLEFDSNNPLLPKHVKHIMVTLEFLHVKCGIQHRDLSRKHFQLSPNGDVFLIDLGSASKIGESADPEGSLPSAATSLLDAFINRQDKHIAKPSDDLESAYKSVILTWRAQVRHHVGKACSQPGFLAEVAEIVKAVWAPYLSDDVLGICQRCEYHQLLALLTDVHHHEVLGHTRQNCTVSPDMEQHAKPHAKHAKHASS